MSQYSDLLSPDQEQIVSALDAFTNAKIWQDRIEVVKAQKDLLLSEAAFKNLCERITRSKAGQRNPAQSTEKLERHLRFLEDSTGWGLARAFNA